MTFPKKIVSLCPSITETLIDFGLAESLVGITRFCIHPESVVKNLEKIGGTKDPKLNQIKTLDPNLIFMNAEENRKEDYETLKTLFTVDVSEPRSVQEVPELLRHFATVTNRSTEGEARAQELEEELSALDKERTQQQTKFRYAYLIWRKPWMVVGQDTYVSRLFADAGGINVFADSPDRYPTVELEALSNKNPDFVFLADEPFPFETQHIPELQTMCPASNIRVISGDDCCWHGVRSIQGVRAMRRLVKELADLDA